MNFTNGQAVHNRIDIECERTAVAVHDSTVEASPGSPTSRTVWHTPPMIANTDTFELPSLLVDEDLAMHLPDKPVARGARNRRGARRAFGVPVELQANGMPLLPDDAFPESYAAGGAGGAGP